ncbi:hypothetical protein [Comamonas sp. NoAH]|uniref:hypothetical protein n=1 Tax=Comamonas halotolerans TaxID=3041496 RepID=UPI0024E0D9C4|nr:hypothetical protein [Comamonas sp. NoAH]
MSNKDTRNSRQIVLDAINELVGQEHVITRENLQATTGLTMHIIDDHVSRMVDEEGTLRRVRPGVYELAKGIGKMPNVYFTDIGEDNSLIIEVDDCGKLVINDPRVARKIAERLSGNYAQVAMLEMKYQFGVVSQDLMLELKTAKRELTQRINDLEAEKARLLRTIAERPAQTSLSFDAVDAVSVG